MLAYAHRFARAEVVPGLVLRVRDQPVDEGGVAHVAEYESHVCPPGCLEPKQQARQQVPGSINSVGMLEQRPNDPERLAASAIVPGSSGQSAFSCGRKIGNVTDARRQ